MGVAIGIEIGGTKLQAGVGRQDGQVLAVARQQVDRAGGAAGIRQALPGMISQALLLAGLSPDEAVAIGVGFGGPVRAERGVTVISNQVEGWADFPLKRWLEARYHVPTVVENDADAAGYAEAAIGAGTGCRRVLYVTIGSGIGGGWIVDGAIDHGQGLGAMEIGHTWVPYPDTSALAELERVASGWAIGRRARLALSQGASSSMCELAGGEVGEVTAETVYRAAEQGDALAAHILAGTCDALAMGLGNAINLYHPQRVILGGGVSLMGPLFWEPLCEQTRRYVYGPFAEGYELVPAGLGEQVVVIGALLLAWQAAGRPLDDTIN